MAKAKPSQLKRKRLWWAAVIGLVIIAGVAGWYVWTSNSGPLLEHDYGKLVLPSNLHLKSVQYVPGGVDGPPSYEYAYSVTSTRGPVYQSMLTDIAAGGYKPIAGGRTDNVAPNNIYNADSDLEAQNASNRVDIEITMQPSWTNQDTSKFTLQDVLNQSVTEVDISVERF